MTKGQTVTVVRGVKVPKGTTGVVIWVGTGDYGERVGVKDAAGTVHWTASKNVEVAAPTAPAPAAAAAPVPATDARIAALEARVAALEATLAQLLGTDEAPEPIPTTDPETLRTLLDFVAA